MRIALFLFAASLLWAQPRELKTLAGPDPDVPVHGKPERCGPYFFAYPAVDEHGPLLFYVLAGPDPATAVITERDEFRVVIEERMRPAVEWRDDPKGIEGHVIVLRIAGKDYRRARKCLPKPASAANGVRI